MFGCKDVLALNVCLCALMGCGANKQRASADMMQVYRSISFCVLRLLLFLCFIFPAVFVHVH